MLKLRDLSDLIDLFLVSLARVAEQIDHIFRGVLQILLFLIVLGILLLELSSSFH